MRVNPNEMAIKVELYSIESGLLYSNEICWQIERGSRRNGYKLGELGAFRIKSCGTDHSAAVAGLWPNLNSIHFLRRFPFTYNLSTV